MIVKWIKYKDGYVYTTDITEAVSSVSWGGSTSQAARTAEIAVINAPNDKNVTDLKLKIAAGDTIKLYENNTTLFIGEVITKETTSETGTVTYSCTDLLNHLLKSTGVYNFSNTTAERITKKVCADFEIDTGTVVETKATIKKMIIDGSSIYDIIMMAYTKAASAYNLTQYDNITAQQGKKSVAEIAQEVIAGAWGNGTERKEKLEAAGYNYAEVQAIVNERAGNKTENKVDNKKSIAEIAQEVVAGKWGNGSERKQRLEAEGYDYAEVQATVNNIMGKSQPNKKNVAEIANEVISGKWGNGSERKEKLEAAGYNYAEVQAKVNEMLR